MKHTEKRPHPIDIHVGSRIRLRRLMMGASQESIAGKLGVTFQQVQKYEQGTNRISASRLAMIAATLGVSVSYFFECMGEEARNSIPGTKSDEGTSGNTADLMEFVGSPQGVRMNRAFSKMPKHLQNAVVQLTEAIGS